MRLRDEERIDKIAAGIEDAIAFAQGDEARARIVKPVDLKALRERIGKTQGQFSKTSSCRSAPSGLGAAPARAGHGVEGLSVDDRGRPRGREADFGEGVASAPGIANSRFATRKLFERCEARSANGSRSEPGRRHVGFTPRDNSSLGRALARHFGPGTAQAGQPRIAPVIPGGRTRPKTPDPGSVTEIPSFETIRSILSAMGLRRSLPPS